MRENDAPEPLPKPESLPPEVLRLHEYSGSNRHFAGADSSTYDGIADSVPRPDYATLSSNLQAGARYPQNDGRIKRICGVRRATFIFFVILSFIIIAAVVGGAVGGSIAVQKASTSTSTTPSTPSSSTTSLYIIPTSGVSVPLDCPNINGQTRSITLGGKTTVTFTLDCGRDYPDASQDILGIKVYALEDCLHACAAYNHASNSKDCILAVFIADVSDANSRGNVGPLCCS
ncbi:eukaryotic aspartyl protease [Apiospora arundinis]